MNLQRTIKKHQLSLRKKNFLAGDKYMPNGGSDCCGTCWFNSKNEGKPGYHGSEKPGTVRCIIRNIEPESPFYTYCANHPHHNKQMIPVPIGPVYIDDFPYRKVWLEAPGSEEIALQLLQLLNSISNEVQSVYPCPLDFEEIVIDELMKLKEKRAIPGLREIIKMDIRVYYTYDPDNIHHACSRNKASIVGKAIEALLYISDGKYLNELDFFIEKGIEHYNPADYTKTKDNFATIRYHLVSGLRYCPFDKALVLLDISKRDPDEPVRKLSEQLIDRIESAAKKSAYGRRRGTTIIDTQKGIMVVTHDNYQYLLPGGSPKRGELQIQTAIRELREETGLRAYEVRYLFTHMAAKVFLIRAEGMAEPKNEITHIGYYQKGSKLNVSNNTRLIIEKYWDYDNI